MNKKIKGAVCAVVGATMLLTATAGCNKEKLDPEVRQLQLSTSALDGNFNPFFYTSGNDGNIISLTQIGMMTNDARGNLVCGEDQPTAVLDYKVTMKDRNGNVKPDGDTQGSTEYEFVIKNGIKFSDGVELTIKDVLFNLYVYLDRTYTGSSTIYSTDIKGLKAYREQRYIGDDAEVDDSRFTSAAIERVQSLIDWSDDYNKKIEDLTAQQAKDLATVRELFRKEAESDWTNISTSWHDSYKDSYRFTATWQAYLFNEGLVSVQQKQNPNGAIVDIYDDTNGNGEKDDGELYYTTLDPNQDSYMGKLGEVAAKDLIDEVAAATPSNEVNAYMQKEGCTEEQAIEELQRKFCIDKVVENYTSDNAKSKISTVLQYWGTASSALEAFTGDEITKYYDKIKEDNGGELLIKTISGITTYKTSSFSGGEFGATLNGQHDVLKIVINGIDPKAIYNFSFSVSPMHYYSGKYNGKDYYKEAMDDNNETITHFGVDAGNKDFFDEVVQAPEKNGLPVGAGCYKATTQSGGDEAESSTFFKNNIVYFKRNDYFTTLGSGINNAKIKYVNYKVYNDDKILTALIAKEIDFGMPNATNDNVNLVSINKKFLALEKYKNNGYGYVGINPKYVPELYVRQAIMKAMDANMTVSYYSGMAQQIYRPLSTESWAYPNGIGEYDSIKYTTVDKDITDLVEKAGYTKVNGVYTKTSTSDRNISHASMGTKLKLSFTIAGESKDHPAYQMFLRARDRLNSLGFDITVKPDIQALKSLNTGGLAVWAAAYTSTIDPDMYQVYHKDSNATSVNNWNYKNILNAQSKWPYEYGKIQELSDKIDAARKTTVQATREDIYHECYDIVMDLAVQLPTYQRKDLAVYNKNRIKASSLVAEPNSLIGLFDKIWEIEYV